MKPMIKIFYFPVESQAAGAALAEHFASHHGLEFVTEDAIEGTLDEIVQVFLDSNVSKDRAIRRYGEIA